MVDSNPQQSDSTEQPRRDRQPLQFSLTTLLAITTGFSLCLFVAVWTADPIVLPAMLGAVLLRIILGRGPRHRMQAAISACVGATVALLACLVGWNTKHLNPDVILPDDASFIEFMVIHAPVNALRSYFTSGTLAFFLCFEMLKQPATSEGQLARRMSGLVVMAMASIFVATIMGCEHFPIHERH